MENWTKSESLGFQGYDIDLQLWRLHWFSSTAAALICSFSNLKERWDKLSELRLSGKSVNIHDHALSFDTCTFYWKLKSCPLPDFFSLRLYPISQQRKVICLCGTGPADHEQGSWWDWIYSPLFWNQIFSFVSLRYSWKLNDIQWLNKIVFKGENQRYRLLKKHRQGSY